VRPPKDPLRPGRLSLDSVESLIGIMDCWQLAHLGLLCILPPRPDEFVGLLISDVDFVHRRLVFRTRFGGNDFSKGRQSFVMPYPSAIEPLLIALVGGRTEGPLFRTRSEFARPSRSILSDTSALVRRFDAHLAALPRERVQTEQDRKTAFRQFLCKMGGVTSDRLTKEFKSILSTLRSQPVARMYDLRHAVIQMMKDSGMPHIDLLYLTSHSTGDIINTYSSITPDRSMERYFELIPKTLEAIAARAAELGLAASQNQAVPESRSEPSSRSG
jgi:hypothetical protein